MNLHELAGKPAPQSILENIPPTPPQKAVLKKLFPDMVTARELAGEQITAKLI